ncbi:MAG TPA: anaerobic ribonucleoside triphosphate reductase [Firmicutes bacterium]|nr:anaerobic ribonucleoside triphosphate reductase [Bacillota bacterium]
MTGGAALPFKEIRKRDGRIVPFDARKITQAIFKAARAVGGENYSLAEELTDEVIKYLQEQTLPGLIPTVEEMQDMVEKILIEKGHARTAKAYILYRAKRTRIREAKSELMDVVKDILLEGNGEEEDSNFSPAEKMHQIALAASQKYYLDNLLPQEIADAYQRGSIHIHHLGYYSKTLDSLHIDLLPLLKNGFGNNRNSPPRDLLTVLFRTAVILQKSSFDMCGEQSLPFFDTVLGEIIRGFKTRPTFAELAAGLRGFFSYLRSLPCLGNDDYLNCSIQLGLDTTVEGREITGLLLKEIIQNKYKRPKIVFYLKRGINLTRGDPNYDLYVSALRTAMRTGNPSFCFLDTSYNALLGANTCYFASGVRVAQNRQGPPGGKKRGNIATVTINLPRLALTTGDQELFFIELDRLLRLGTKQLLHRFEVVSLLKCKDLPFIMGEKLYLGSENLFYRESIRDSLKNGLITLGFCGLPEAVRVLSDCEKGAKNQGYSLAAEIVKHMSRRVESFATEYDLNIGLRGVDCRGLRGLAEKDRKDFGVVKGVTEKDFYRCCFVLFQEDEGFEKKVALEGEIHRCCSAGYSSRVIFSPGMEASGAEEIMLKLMEADIGHFCISTFDEGLNR